MSDKLQDTKQTRTALILVAAVIVGVTGWYVMQSSENANKSLDDTEKVQATENESADDAYKGWKAYSWEAEGISFKYPGDWLVGQNGSDYRLYVKNVDVDLAKAETPDNFQQVWLSADQDEASAVREAAIKNGESAYRVVDGEVKASTVKAGGLTINTYEYNTVGGVTVEAYWADKDGKRYYATNSTEVGEANQTEMVATLKKVLASIEQK